MCRIVKIERRPEFGLAHWKIYGLNIFDYNDVPQTVAGRPDVVFLTELTARHACSAHVGSLVLSQSVETPEEIFGPHDGAIPFTRTRVGFYDGFYNLDEYPCFDSCFFPQVTPRFWQALREGDALEQLLSCHSMAFYVAPRLETLEGMYKLLAAPFPGQAQWLTAVTGLYGAVLTVGHDGQFFHIYAGEEVNLQRIVPSLTAAAQTVEASEWFQAHKQELAWDDELNCCLMLPTKK